MTRYGAVEIGGTKTDVAVGSSPDDLSTPHRIPTTTPDETLSAVAMLLASHEVVAIGVASFGPLDLDPSSPGYGRILATPKPDWTGASVLETIHTATGVPVQLDTDVNGAALGEGRWGAARGMSDYVYITVGTGIGAGVVVDGRVISGERHPEAGHLVVSRREGDEYPGNCPYHGDCLEGMANGPALEARFGRPGTWAGNEAVLDVGSHYLAQGLRDLVYTVAPERMIIGGGVSRIPYFHERLRSKLGQLLAGYPDEPDLDLLVAKPGLGHLSGLAGGLILAERAAG
ncbi:MAG TPA: ROK family protein [Acidimicrobiia bacterium]